MSKSESQIQANQIKLEEEVRAYRKEKEKIKQILSAVSGQKNNKKERAVTILFVALIAAFFGAGFVFDNFSQLLSIEIGVLLVSIKIIMLMQNQQKSSHFQFWVLNTLEFKIDQIDKRLASLESASKQGLNSENK